MNDINIKNSFIRNTGINFFIKNECITFRRSIIDYFFYSNCQIYKNIINQSINSWSSIYNYYIIISNIEDSNLIFKIDFLNNNKIGSCQNNLQYPNIIYNSIIKINKNKCFHNNQLTCNIINQIEIFNMDIHFGIGGSFFFGFFGFLLLFIKKKKKIYNNLLFLYFIIYFFLMFIYWNNIRSCIDCFDFSKIILHEIGHALGLSHSNTIKKSIMTDIYNSTINTCIYQTDLEIYNQLYNTSFNNTICNILQDSDIYFLKDILFFCFFFSFIIIIAKYTLKIIQHYLLTV